MGLRWAALAVGVVLSSTAVAAEDVKTAQGAQQFLAELVKTVQTKVEFKDAAGWTNYVTGKYTGQVKTIKGGLRKQKETIENLPEKFVDQQLPDLRASVLEPMDRWGRANACATRITEVTAPPYDVVKSDANNDTRSFSWTLTYTNETWTYEPLTKFMSPAEVIDWSNASVARGAENSIFVASKGHRFPTIYLRFVAENPDLADRIEYAVKFLVMSCSSSPRLD